MHAIHCDITTGKPGEMSTSEVFQHFFPQLVNILPMNDVTFTAQMFSSKLLPGNVKDQVKSQATQADKATYFLDHVIKPSLTSGVGSSFNKLLKVMEDSEYDDVKELSQQIRSRLRDSPANNIETGELT